jgi:hypothetical protein
MLAVLATVVAASLGQTLLDDGRLVWRAAVLALGGGGLLLWLVAKHLTAASFGLANLVTLARGALTLLLLALLGAPAGTALGWLAVALGIAAVALDGVDGQLARSRGEVSDFGARFDMETDALLILVLAALVWQLDKAGAWILLAGLLRYLFVPRAMSGRGSSDHCRRVAGGKRFACCRSCRCSARSRHSWRRR